MDEPADYRERYGTEEGRHKAIDGEARDNSRHCPKKKRVEDERKEAEGKDGYGERKQVEDGLDDQ